MLITRRSLIKAAGAGALIIPAATFIQPQEAFAAIGTPVNLGNTAASAVVTLALTTVGTASTGDTIVIAHHGGTNLHPATGYTDSSGNAYRKINGWVADTCLPDFWYCPNCIALASASTITGTFGGGNGNNTFSVFSVSGLDPLGGVNTPSIVSQTTASTTTSAVSIATGTLIQANELMVGYMGWGNTPGTVTPGGGFTLIGTVGTGTTQRIQMAYLITASTAPVAFAPTWVTARTGGTALGGLLGSPVTGGGGLLLRGVG